MINFLKKFRRNENGAVTVDWVLLTAGVVAMATAAYTAINSSASSLADSAGKYVSDQVRETSSDDE